MSATEKKVMKDSIDTFNNKFLVYSEWSVTDTILQISWILKYCQQRMHILQRYVHHSSSYISENMEWGS